MKTVLVHCCCAHCSAYTVSYWRSQGCDVRGLWYNPNIHPFMEHERRREAVVSLAQSMELPLTVIERYDMLDFLRGAAGKEGQRCRHCFHMRLSKTAETAKQLGISSFTTTLLISPHQKHELIRQIGGEVSAAAGVEFLYADLRKGFSESRRFTKGLDLYRQQYCGCIYSEWERYGNLCVTG